jgi:hypothetical protein
MFPSEIPRFMNLIYQIVTCRVLCGRDTVGRRRASGKYYVDVQSVTSDI